MSDKINVKVNCVLSKAGTEELQKKLKSYNLGKEFNYAVAVIKVLLTNGEENTDININLVPKVQYIVPFISKELAQKYCKELSSLNKLMMFLVVDEYGRVEVQQKNIEDTMNDISDNVDIGVITKNLF